MEQVDASIGDPRALGRADREEGDMVKTRSIRQKEKSAGLRQRMQALKRFRTHPTGRSY